MNGFGIDWRSVVRTGLDFIFAAHLLLFIFPAVLFFAEQPDRMNAPNVMGLLALVWSLGALIERGRS